MFEKSIADRSKKNPKAFWAHTRRKLKTKSGVAPLLEDVEDKNSLKFNDQDKANILQKQFSSVFTREPDGDIPPFEARTDSVLSDMQINEKMVKERLDKINISKSCRPDDVHPRILFELRDHLAEPISILFNQILEVGYLPKSWKTAFITAIFKKGERNM